MIYKRFLTISLFVVSFVVIALGGYQCAELPSALGPSANTGAGETEEPIQNPTNSPATTANTANANGASPPVNTGSSLPQEPEKEEGCSASRAQYRDLAKRYGEMALFDFENQDTVEDYRLGAKSNFGIRCARLFLDMKKVYDPSEDTSKSKISKTKLYGGSLTLTYELDGRSIKVIRYSAGETAQENINNRWDVKSSWVPNTNNVVNDKKFHAIFESKNSAVILSLTDVRTRDIRDGVRAYIGGGALFYKMFRCVTDLKSQCHNKGMYIAHSRSDQCNYPRRKPCWQKTAGGFSCLPNGVLPLVNVGSTVREAALPKLDIASKNKRSCYKTLGWFGRLDLEEAFHVKKVTDLK